MYQQTEQIALADMQGNLKPDARLDGHEITSCDRSTRLRNLDGPLPCGKTSDVIASYSVKILERKE